MAIGTVIDINHHFILRNEPSPDEGTTGHGSDAMKALTSAFTDAFNEVGSAAASEAQSPLPVPTGPPPLGSILQLVKETGKSRKECKAALMACNNDCSIARQQLAPAHEGDVNTPKDTTSNLLRMKRGSAAPYLVQLDRLADSGAPAASLVSVAVDNDHQCRALSSKDEIAHLLSKEALATLRPGDILDQDLWDSAPTDTCAGVRVLATRLGLRLATALLQACLRGEDETLRCVQHTMRAVRDDGMLFTQLVACSDAFEVTPLAGACMHGHETVVRTLLEGGARVGSMQAHETSPLQSACSHGQTACVRLLLEAKALVNERSSSGQTPLIASVCSGHVEVVKLLLTHRSPALTFSESRNVLCLANDALLEAQQREATAQTHGVADCIRVLLDENSGAALPLSGSDESKQILKMMEASAATVTGGIGASASANTSAGAGAAALGGSPATEEAPAAEAACAAPLSEHSSVPEQARVGRAGGSARKARSSVRKSKAKKATTPVPSGTPSAASVGSPSSSGFASGSEPSTPESANGASPEAAVAVDLSSSSASPDAPLGHGASPRWWRRHLAPDAFQASLPLPHQVAAAAPPPPPDSSQDSPTSPPAALPPPPPLLQSSSPLAKLPRSCHWSHMANRPTWISAGDANELEGQPPAAPLLLAPQLPPHPLLQISPAGPAPSWDALQAQAEVLRARAEAAAAADPGFAAAVSAEAEAEKAAAEKAAVEAAADEALGAAVASGQLEELRLCIELHAGNGSAAAVASARKARDNMRDRRNKHKRQTAEAATKACAALKAGLQTLQAPSTRDAGAALLADAIDEAERALGRAAGWGVEADERLAWLADMLPAARERLQLSQAAAANEAAAERVAAPTAPATAAAAKAATAEASVPVVTELSAAASSSAADGKDQPKEEVEEDDDQLCIVCLEALRTHVLVPCGHQCVCEGCSSTLVRTGTCPLCREPCQMAIRVFK